jgi:hypothetical protein
MCPAALGTEAGQQNQGAWLQKCSLTAGGHLHSIRLGIVTTLPCTVSFPWAQVCVKDLTYETSLLL